jgi:hypothetical protein
MNQLKNSYLLAITVAFIILLVYTCTQEPCGEGEVLSSSTTVDSLRTHHENYKDSIENWITHDFSDVPLTRIDTNEVLPDNGNFAFHGEPEEDTSEVILRASEDTSSSLFTFYYEKRDSSLEYTIRVDSDCKPESVSMEYKVKEVTHKDSTYVRDSIYVKQVDKVRTNQIYMGPEAIVYPNLQAAFFSIDFINKKGWQLEIGGGADITTITKPKPMLKAGFKWVWNTRRKKKNE